MSMVRTRTIALQSNSTLLPWVLLIASLLSSVAVFGQKRLVDKRSQAEGWFLPVHGRVLEKGEKCTDYHVVLYKDNKVLAPVVIDKKGRFVLELDIDNAYTVRIGKPGYTDKLLYIDTALPKDRVVYPDYEMVVGLTPVGDSGIDPFYADFPTGIVRWSPEMEGFYHSEPYLAHIQSKLTGYATAQ